LRRVTVKLSQAVGKGTERDASAWIGLLKAQILLDLDYPGMAVRSELLLDGNREQRASETEFVAVGVNYEEEALTPFGIAGP
jgi:hypothetical protein